MAATNPRSELQAVIAAKLRSDPYCNEHFALSCHADDIAELVVKTFYAVEDEWSEHDTSTYAEKKTLRSRALVARMGRESQTIMLTHPNRQV